MPTPTVAPAKHPAKFNAKVLEVVGDLLLDEYRRKHRTLHVLDPFAGVGGIHSLANEHVVTYGLELEPEWAEQDRRTLVGDVLTSDLLDGSRFDGIVTSPCYGNRMADCHDAQEICSMCKGDGILTQEGVPVVLAQQEWTGGKYVGVTRVCPKCDGKGVREYKRITYKHQLGRDLSINSAAGLQWGPKYRSFHEAAWTRVDANVIPGGFFLLNCKDHVRGGVMQYVTDWHVGFIIDQLGYKFEDARQVLVKGMGFGQNRNARDDKEQIVIMRKLD